MKLSYTPLLLCLGIFPLSSQDTTYTLYSSFENSLSSFQPSDTNSRTVGMGEIQHQKTITLSAEKREERSLASLEGKNQFLYASLGHRYKPIPGFYFLRDPSSYSAFQNTTHGVVQQPLHRSAFLGGSYKDWGAGSFLGKSIAEKQPGIYLKSPKEIFGFAYAPESHVYFSALNLRDQSLTLLKSELTLSSQLYGQKNAFFGYFNAKLFTPKEGLDIRLSLYRENSENQLNPNRDNLNLITEKDGIYFKISQNFTNRIEHFTELYSKGKSSVTGGNASLFSLPFGSLCLGGRIYDRRELNDSQWELLYYVKATSLSVEWKKFSNEFVLRTELRENKDRVYELKTTLRPVPDWRLEISAIAQSPTAQIPSLYEQWSDGENINTIFTDRQHALKVKIIGSYVVLNLSGSRQKNGNEIFYSNLQFKLSF